MSEFIKNSIKKNKPHFLKYKKYIVENDWRILKATAPTTVAKGKIKSTVDYRQEEFNVQNELISAIINRLKLFVKKTDGDHHLKLVKDFIKETLKIIEIHTDRADEYISASDISKIEDVIFRTEEIEFHNHLFKAVSSIDDAVSALNIKEEAVNMEGIVFLDKQKATLPMHDYLVRQYPEIQTKLDLLGVDFNSPPPKKLHILNKNPPIWNEFKNYWEQEINVLQYYIWEYKKIEAGIEIDGYYFDGWLYFHLNHFVTIIPTTVEIGGILENKDVIKVPNLRDNELLMVSYFNKSKREGKISFIAATRRLAKTTLNASRMNRAQVLGKRQILCAGGSAEDLGHISNNIDICNDNINPAFRIYYLSPTKDGRGKSYGIKTKDNKSKVTTNIFIINLEGGSSTKKKETLAGFTPDEFVIDECLKFPFKKQLEALEPALWGDGILRCSVILTGTGGDEDLAKDGIKMLTNPEDNKVCLMDWDELERGVPQELITWQRNRKCGLFLPTQLSVKHKKIESNLADYLGLDSSYLKQVKVMVTDWKTAKENEDKERESKIGDKRAYVRLLAYHPYDPSEIFLSGKISPFPVAEAKKHREYLIESGLWDRRREMFKDTLGNIQIVPSTRSLVEFPHRGGIIDAPFLIFEDPPTEKPRYGMYVGSFDDYATDDSETDSVATFYVMKNKILGDPFSEKIVASISFRPEKHQMVYEKWLLLMEAYNLQETCFGENFNYAIKDYLERRHLADKYLAPTLDFTQTFNLPNNLKRKTGWSPMIKKTLFNMFVDYCNEEFEVENEDGSLLILKGVQRIDDIHLLSEIINYTESGNYDRITSAQANVSFCHFLNSSHRWRPTIYKLNREEEKPKEREDRPRSFYSNSQKRAGFYNSRNRR